LYVCIYFYCEELGGKRTRIGRRIGLNKSSIRRRTRMSLRTVNVKKGKFIHEAKRTKMGSRTSIISRTSRTI